MKACRAHLQSLRSCIEAKAADVALALDPEALTMLRAQCMEDMKQIFKAEAYKRFGRITIAFPVIQEKGAEILTLPQVAPRQVTRSCGSL